ncbi:MAG: translocation/assembly module TamB domain-containing protein, partial [Rikenellaceae bacterium]
TMFKIELFDLNTSAADIYHIIDDFTGSVPKQNNILKNAGNINLSGEFDGSFERFKSKGVIKTLEGKIDFQVSNTKVQDAVKIAGSVSTKNFNSGMLFGVNSLGNVDFQGNIDSYLAKDSVNVDINSKIDSLTYLGYRYSDIAVNGTLTDKTFKGHIGIGDKNLDLDFNGLIELGSTIPQYDFKLDIKHANLFATNINKRDTISIISGGVTADGSGTTLDNLNGTIKLQNVRYENHIDTVNVEMITIVAENSENNKSLRLRSNFTDLDLTAKQSYNNIIPYLTETINTYLPAIRDNEIDITNFKIKVPVKKEKEKEIEQAQNSFYVATINVKEANNVASIFVPGLNIAKNSTVAFVFNPALNQFSFSLKSDTIERGDYWAHNININSRNMADSIYLFASADQVNLKSIYLPNLQIIGGVKNNNIYVSTRFNNDYDGSNALITTKAQFEKNGDSRVPRISAQVLPSYFTISKVKWLMGSHFITIDSTRIDVDRFMLRSGDQKIDIDGVFSQNETDTLSVNISKVNLDGFSTFVKSLGYNINGNLNGNIKLIKQDIFHTIATDLSIQQIKINQYDIPNIYLKSVTKNKSTVEYQLSTPHNKLISALFDYSTKKLNASVKIKDVDLQPLTPIMSVIGTNCGGYADIDVDIDNMKRPLNINGRVDIKDFGTTISFTGVHYKINGNVTIKDNVYTLNSGMVTDPDGISAPFTASLNGGDRYAKVRYKIGVKPNALLCLNTTLENNALFYGNIHATGALEVVGHGNNVTMTIAASAVNNSKFYMPLSDKSTISEADFITFVKHDTLDKYTPRDLINIKRKERRASNALFTLDITARVSPDTEVQLVIDPTLGDIIKARGNGELTMHIVPARDIFSIVGGYEITDGNYLFTLPNFKLLNKYFTIKPGSTINWTGNPLSANLNVTAVYKTKTSLAPLLGSLPQYSRRVDVNCNLSLSGQLLKPDITLGITVPDADPETSGLITTALNTEEAVSKQIFWLLFS